MQAVKQHLQREKDSCSAESINVYQIKNDNFFEDDSFELIIQYISFLIILITTLKKIPLC